MTLESASFISLARKEKGVEYSSLPLDRGYTQIGNHYFREVGTSSGEYPILPLIPPVPERYVPYASVTSLVLCLLTWVWRPAGKNAIRSLVVARIAGTLDLLSRGRDVAA